ncbi:MAG: zinc ribbon domain-containing protein [Deltaproteobacteria bacterium]|nr:zinc ribbon domain-containing protein [Deltaproteobacteria bacterium]
MPIYEYKCTACGREFEVFQGINDPEIGFCSACNGPAKKLLSLSSFQLKGSGWYVTDYGGKKPSTKESSTEESAAPVAEPKEKVEPKEKTEAKTD